MWELEAELRQSFSTCVFCMRLRFQSNALNSALLNGYKSSVLAANYNQILTLELNTKPPVIATVSFFDENFKCNDCL